MRYRADWRASIGLAILLSMCVLYMNTNTSQRMRIKSKFAKLRLPVLPGGFQSIQSGQVNCTVTGKQWIVMTSINYVTDAVRSYAKLSGWMTIVVADRKTPMDYVKADFPPGLVYLSMDMQERLPLNLPSIAPTGSYARKNLGYLYAVACGAEVIYETDDDNPLKANYTLSGGLTDLSSQNQQAIGAIGVNPANLVNPYAFYGRPDIWPRGYPLRSLNHKNIDEFINLESTVGTTKRAYIEQFLADGDPDVDAVFRLTRGSDRERVKFGQSPDYLVISNDYYTPYNSQTTLSHYEAFWALYIPATVAFRVCDIWRAYIAKRLLRETDGALVFRPAIVEQIRNAHDLVKDMSEEDDLYMKVEPLIADLDKWTAGEGDMLDHLISIYTWLTERDYFEYYEIDIVTEWVNDMRRVGYRSQVEHKPGQQVTATGRPESSNNAVICTVGSYEDFEQFQATLKESETDAWFSTADIYTFINTNSTTRWFSKLYNQTSIRTIVKKANHFPTTRYQNNAELNLAYKRCNEMVNASYKVIALMPLATSKKTIMALNKIVSDPQTTHDLVLRARTAYRLEVKNEDVYVGTSKNIELFLYT